MQLPAGYGHPQKMSPKSVEKEKKSVKITIAKIYKKLMFHSRIDFSQTLFGCGNVYDKVYGRQMKIQKEQVIWLFKWSRTF